MRLALPRLLPALALLAACSVGGERTDTAAATTPAVDLAREEQAIRDLDVRWMQAVTARDTAAIAKIYATDALFMPPNAQALGGRAGVQKGWGQLFAIPGSQLDFRPTTITVAQAGDVAYDIGTYTFSADGPKGKARIEDKGKYVVVWKKEDGEWRVAADIYNSDVPLP